MKRASISKQRRTRSTRAHGRAALTTDWIPELAEPYLRGYAVKAQAGNGLRGFRFLSPAYKRGARVGFFLGYLVGTSGWKYLGATAPACVVFAFVEPVCGATHAKLVGGKNSLLRETHEYIRWLTHRPPRFQLFDAQTAALVRHIPLNAWPAGRIEHYSRNFFVETLAWLVRSALVRRLA